LTVKLTAAMTYMSDAQKEKFDELKSRWEQYKSLDVSDEMRLEVMACVLIELERLQRYVNQHGPTYKVVGKSGDVYSRARPEYQQLQECRQRLGVLVDKMTAQTGGAYDGADDFVAL